MHYMVSVCLPSDAFLRHPPSYLGFSYLGLGVSLHGCSSKAQPLLLTLDGGHLLTAAVPDLQRGIAPLGPPVPAQPPDGQHRNRIDYILCSQRWRSSIQSTKTRPGADCGSDHQLLIAKFRLKLKKVGKATRPFMNDLNQIPYDLTVEVRNRFKGLDLIDRVPEELWMQVPDIVQESEIKTIPKKKKCKKAKWFSEEALQIAAK